MKVKDVPFGWVWFRTLCHAVGGLIWCGSAVSGLAAVANVNIEDDFFSPSTSSISAGDSVVWTWVGTDGHNVTSESKPTAVWKASPTTFPPFSFTNTFPSAGTFPYECSIHAFEGMLGTIKVAAVAANPPTVSITSPTSGALFAAPATVNVAAMAADSGGTISGVQFLIDTSPISDATTAPYQAVANNVAAGTHTITAIATAGNGLKATNSVTIQVFTPVSVSAPTITEPGSFQFSYSADINSSYVVERSTDLINWVSIDTNSATADPETFTDDNAPSNGAYYRVELLANP